MEKKKKKKQASKQASNNKKKDATPRGFEPLRTKSTHLAGERLNHSAKVSAASRGYCLRLKTHSGKANAKNRIDSSRI